MNDCSLEKRPEIHLVRVRGEVDLSWSQQLRRTILDGLAGAKVLGVELSAVTYIDSSGIAALVEGFQTARGKNQKFILVSTSAPVRSVLQLARLDRVFPMAETVEAALAT